MNRESLDRLRDSQGARGVEKQVQALSHMLHSALQEITALRACLMATGQFNEAEFRKARVQTMLNDHNGAGAFPVRRHSYFRFMLDEEELLRNELGATESEIEEFRKEAHFLARLS